MQLDPARLRLLGDPTTSEGRHWLVELVHAYVLDTRAKHSRLAMAVEQGDASQIKLLAHEQKGVSGMMGAGDVAEHFRSIEEGAADRAIVNDHLSAIQQALDQLDDEVHALVGSSRSE